MFNPFDLIPKSIDPNLRMFLIILVAVQVIAFILYVSFLIYDHVQTKKDPKANPYIDINNASKKEKSE
jgi:hypothetical protein